MMKQKYKFKDYVEAIMGAWKEILELLFVMLILGGIFAYNYWLAGGDIKCTLAQDSATCGAILRDKK